MKKYLTILIIFALSGCAARTLTTDAVALLPDYPDNFRALTKAYVGLNFYDPASARYEFLRPPAPAYRPTLWGLSTLDRGWIWRVVINARNRLGGYAGRAGLEFYLTADGLTALEWPSRYLNHPRRYRIEDLQPKEIR